MKRIKGFTQKNFVFILIIVLVLATAGVVQAVTAEPGTDGDPIVTQGYVDAKVNELNIKLTESATSIANLSQQLGSMQQVQASKYESVNLKAGQEMIGGESTEIIVRTGQAKAVSATEIGIADLTGGKDILNGGSIVNNHLLLVPRADGRGIKVSTEAWVMVKGSYTIK